MNWKKEERMRALAKFKEDGMVDKDIIPVLDLVNKRKDSFTSSSCAGRIVILELPELGDKRRANFIGKWHHEPDEQDIIKALQNYKGQLLYLLAQPPILHIYSRTAREAEKMLKTGRESGFKDSGYRTISGPFLIALVTTEHLNVPLGGSGKIYPADDYLGFLLERANSAFRRSRKKLNRLKEALETL